MKKSKHLRYFKNLTVYLLIGGAVALVGFILYRYSWELWPLGTPILMVGAAIIAACLLYRIDERHYTEYVKNKFDAMPNDPDRKPDHIFEGYIFADNKYAKIDRSGSPRSEIYRQTHIYRGERLEVVIGEFNVEYDRFEVQTVSFERASAEIENFEVKINGAQKKLARMRIYDETSECVFPVNRDDIETDTLAAVINEKYGK